MIPKSMLLGILKPLLPKLEGFLNSHKDLESGEKAKILLDVIDSQIYIQIVALKQKENGEFIITKVLQDIKPEQL